MKFAAASQGAGLGVLAVLGAFAAPAALASPAAPAAPAALAAPAAPAALAAPATLAAPTAGLTCVLADGPPRATLDTRDGRHLVVRDGSLQVGERRVTVCDGLPGGFPSALAESPVDGAIYIGFRREGVWRWDGAGFTAVNGLPVAARNGGVRALAMDGHELWVATGTAGLWHGPADATLAPVTHKVLGHQAIFALQVVATARGTGEGAEVQAAAGPYGAWRLRSRGARGVAATRITGGFVGCFDAAGRSEVYCASATEPALPRHPPTSHFTSVASVGGVLPPRHPPTSHFTSVASVGGVLYAGSFDRGLFARGDDGSFQPIDGLPPFINTLVGDGQTLYVGTARGLYTLEVGQRAARAVPGLSEPVNALAIGPGRALAVGTSHGAYVLEGGRVRHLGEADGLPGRQCWAVAWSPGPSGAVLWVGTADGLVRFEAGARLEVFTQSGGHLPHDWVTALLWEGESMLVGTYDAGVVGLTPDPAAAQGWRRETRLSGAWVNPMGLARVEGTVLVSTLGGGVGALGGPGFHSLLPGALDDVTAVAVHTVGRSGAATGSISQRSTAVWFATRGGLVHAPEGWYPSAHDTEQAHTDSPCADGLPGRRVAAGLRLERGR